MDIKAFGDRILIKRDEDIEKTKGGIFLPDTAKKKVNFGTVVSVGEGKLLDNGERRKIPVNDGQKVCFALYAGYDMKLDNGETLVMIKEEDLFGIIEEGDYQ